MPRIEPGYKANFDTLERACLAGQLALMDCRDRVTGEPVRVIVVVSRSKDGGVDIVPLARMFDGNPYDELDPPDPDNPDGYLEAEKEGGDAVN